MITNVNKKEIVKYKESKRAVEMLEESVGALVHVAESMHGIVINEILLSDKEGVTILWSSLEE